MKDKPNNIDRTLREIRWPDVSNEAHRQALRRRVLAVVERNRTMSTSYRIRSLFLIVLGLMGGGALAMTVGVKIYRHHFEGQSREGDYIFTSERETLYEGATDANDQRATTSVSTSTTTSMNYQAPADAAPATEAEKIAQMQQDLEEIDALRQRNERELLKVVDQWINGRFHRTCIFQYTLADGRVRGMGENDLGLDNPPSPEQIKRDDAEVDRLRAEDQREITRIIETGVAGRIMRICMFQYTLGDGRTTSVGENGSDPNTWAPVLSQAQAEEVWRLRRLKEGEFLGDLDREAEGHVFSCETYRFTLADGTVVIHAVGDRKDYKTHLTDADREEMQRLRTAGTGERLEDTEQDVYGQRFRFERRRYLLSDGTEVIRAYGTPVP